MKLSESTKYTQMFSQEILEIKPMPLPSGFLVWLDWMNMENVGFVAPIFSELSSKELNEMHLAKLKVAGFI